MGIIIASGVYHCLCLEQHRSGELVGDRASLEVLYRGSRPNGHRFLFELASQHRDPWLGPDSWPRVLQARHS